MVRTYGAFVASRAFSRALAVWMPSNNEKISLLLPQIRIIWRRISRPFAVFLLLCACFFLLRQFLLSQGLHYPAAFRALRGRKMVRWITGHGMGGWVCWFRAEQMKQLPKFIQTNRKTNIQASGANERKADNTRGISERWWNCRKVDPGRSQSESSNELF